MTRRFEGKRGKRAELSERAKAFLEEHSVAGEVCFDLRSKTYTQDLKVCNELGLKGYIRGPARDSGFCVFFRIVRA